MKAHYQEYLLSEVPQDMMKVLNVDYSFLPGMSSTGVTLCDGNNPSESIRVRIYSDETARTTGRHYAIVLDALKGAAIPIEDIKAALDKCGCSSADKVDILRDIESADILERCQH